MDEKQAILDSLEPLFERAEKNGLWFHCSYQDLWFSPKQLRQHHIAGQFIWGTCNWDLRDPMEYAEYLKEDADHAIAKYHDFMAEIYNNK